MTLTASPSLTTGAKSRCKAKDPSTCRFHGTPVPRPPKEVRVPVYDRYGAKVRKHANVDKFERTTREFLCLDETDPTRQVMLKELHALPDDEKPIVYRGLSKEDLDTELTKIRTTMEHLNGQPLKLVTTHNNQDYYDFYDLNTKKLFELKLGELTTGNNGVGLMDWALNTNGNELGNLFRASMNERIKMWDEGHKRRRNLEKLGDEVMAHRIKTAGTVLGVVAFNANRPEAKQRLSHMSRCYIYGITRQKAMEESYARYLEYKRDPSKFNFKNEQELEEHIYGKTLPNLIRVNKNRDIEVVKNNSKDPLESFEITACELTNNGQGIRLKLRGKKSGNVIDIIQNYKNNLHRTDKPSIPARYGVTSPAFYAWVRPPKPDTIVNN